MDVLNGNLWEHLLYEHCSAINDERHYWGWGLWTTVFSAIKWVRLGIGGARRLIDRTRGCYVNLVTNILNQLVKKPKIWPELWILENRFLKIPIIDLLQSLYFYKKMLSYKMYLPNAFVLNMSFQKEFLWVYYALRDKKNRTKENVHVMEASFVG